MLAKKKNVELRLNHINSNHNNKSNAVSTKWKSNRQTVQDEKRKGSKKTHSRLSGKKGQEGELHRIQTEAKD